MVGRQRRHLQREIERRSSACRDLPATSVCGHERPHLRDRRVAVLAQLPDVFLVVVVGEQISAKRLDDRRRVLAPGRDRCTRARTSTCCRTRSCRRRYPSARSRPSSRRASARITPSAVSFVVERALQRGARSSPSPSASTDRAPSPSCGLRPRSRMRPTSGLCCVADQVGMKMPSKVIEA